MALLMSCWFLIETILIPDGFQKWFYLSFYIHPFFLCFCQIFLWLKLLTECLVFVLSLPFRIIYVSCFFVFGLFRKCIISLFQFTRFKTAEYEEEVEEYFETQPYFNSNQIALSCVLSREASLQYKIKLLEIEGVVEDTTREDYLFCSSDENSSELLVQIESNAFPGRNNFADGSISILEVEENMQEPMFSASEDMSRKENLLCSPNSFATQEYSNELLPVCSSISQDKDPYGDEFSTAVCASGLQLVESEVSVGRDTEESDELYKKYTERMGWFDVLNYDRTCGISAIQNKQLGSPGSYKSIEPPTSGVLQISWTKMAKRRLLRSLESDFEMVYVAQSCLSWEALHHQYRKVKALECSSSPNIIFSNNVAGEFQKFQVLLERFMEDEQSEGKRVWNYVRGRFSLKSLLQVPEVSVLLVEEKEEGANLKEALKAIEECIQAFWMFVKADNSKKPWWKARSSSWTCPPVEDPRDLELLAEVTKRLQKNKLLMKDLQGKKRCCIRRIVLNCLEESERKEMMFTMIDMKLVSRVLQMSMLSSSQLKWCQEKLDKIEFKHGKVIRESTYNLFPP
ncbi:hypothetical protein UlMin_014719 [Ulmus minor]